MDNNVLYEHIGRMYIQNVQLGDYVKFLLKEKETLLAKLGQEQDNEQKQPGESNK
jgi:hypothetical protein